MVSPDRQQLRFLLAVPRTDCPPGRGACGSEASPCQESGCSEEETCCSESYQESREGEDSQEKVSHKKTEGHTIKCALFILRDSLNASEGSLRLRERFFAALRMTLSRNYQ